MRSTWLDDVIYEVVYYEQLSMILQSHEEFASDFQRQHSSQRSLLLLVPKFEIKYRVERNTL